MSIIKIVFSLMAIASLCLIFASFLEHKKSAKTLEEKKLARSVLLNTTVIVLFVWLLVMIILYSISAPSGEEKIDKEIAENCSLVRIDDGGNWDGTRAIYNCPNGEIIKSISKKRREELMKKIATK